MTPQELMTKIQQLKSNPLSLFDLIISVPVEEILEAQAWLAQATDEEIREAMNEESVSN